MLCPAQDNLVMENSLEDPKYRRRFNFIVRPRYVVDGISKKTSIESEKEKIKIVDAYVDDL
jgi:hypothetical protein